MIQLLGFAGSSLVILSSTMQSVGRLRFLALMGSMTFIVYGTAVGAWPVVASNTFTSLIHLYNLRSMAGARRRGPSSSVERSNAERHRRPLRPAPGFVWPRFGSPRLGWPRSRPRPSASTSAFAAVVSTTGLVETVPVHS